MLRAGGRSTRLRVELVCARVREGTAWPYTYDDANNDRFDKVGLAIETSTFAGSSSSSL